ncbi:MAG: NAD-dependent protein deacylase [Bulleidia sp.]
MKQKIEQLQAILDQGKRILFFTGAGVSTDSGIPDFRSADGLYSGAYAYPPETILSHTFFLKNTAEFYHFYREKMLPGNARPNAVHLFIAEMEKSGRSLGVVTQNIDGLHQKAGSKNVYELHGSVFRNYCTRCHAFYGIDTIKNTDGIPYCSKCGGIIKPDVVLYEEALPEATVAKACAALEAADVLVVLGTSLRVYPAAGFLQLFHGEKLVLINRDPTPFDRQVDLLLQAPLHSVFSGLYVSESAD